MVCIVLIFPFFHFQYTTVVIFEVNFLWTVYSWILLLFLVVVVFFFFLSTWLFFSCILINSETFMVIIKKQRYYTTWPTKVQLVKAMVFPGVMYGCESWTIRKAECQTTDAFELWCWRRLLTVKEIQPVHPKGNQS